MESKTLGSILPNCAKEEGRGIYFLHSGTYTPLGVFLDLFAPLSKQYGITTDIFELILDSNPEKYGIVASGIEPKNYRYQRVLLPQLKQQVNYQPIPKSDQFKMFCMNADQLFYYRYNSADFNQKKRYLLASGDVIIGVYSNASPSLRKSLQIGKKRFRKTLDRFINAYTQIPFSNNYFQNNLAVKN